ncbi:pyridoxamine 5'-phosphate oxidase family protein [Pelosinus sp. UFO1]|uniref:pyridoxamine 5'-phosphate oxidase family protein n=1 Tax=Pelosinus sp. UFO1 TaxID=484770 RepID=UPI0004D107F1|nr:pyridoxamine 5'-phosphate oxidase family protein [Pelosinus sp. UFO1]AIF53036.1 Pyridoxamine 5'-phosphate oxidase-related protein [Pelosinus sp. UFO1]
MFREMRRKDRAMVEEETKMLLETAQVGILSTVSTDNTPYGVPMNFVYTNEVIYLHCALEGQRLDNIVNNDSICFTVVDAVELMPAAFATKYKSAVIFGKIIVVEDIEEKRKGLIDIVKKYSPDFYEAGLQYIDKAFEKIKVLKIEVSKMTGKARL